MSGIWLPNTERDYYPEQDHGPLPHPPPGVVIHVNDGTFAGTMDWFHHDGGIGAHVEVGYDRVAQLVSLDHKCYHAVNANNMIGVEHVGYGYDSADKWLRHKGHELAFSANRVAWMHHQFGWGFPRRRRTVWAHSDGGAAWGGHSCPGPSFPWAIYMGMVVHAYNNHWGR